MLYYVIIYQYISYIISFVVIFAIICYYYTLPVNIVSRNLQKTKRQNGNRSTVRFASWTLALNSAVSAWEAHDAPLFSHVSWQKSHRPTVTWRLLLHAQHHLLQTSWHVLTFCLSFLNPCLSFLNSRSGRSHMFSSISRYFTMFILPFSIFSYLSTSFSLLRNFFWRFIKLIHVMVEKLWKDLIILMENLEFSKFWFSAFFAWLKALKDAGGSPTTTAATRRQPQAIQPSATFCRVQTFTRNFSFKGWVRWIRWIHKNWTKIGQQLAEKHRKTPIFDTPTPPNSRTGASRGRWAPFARTSAGWISSGDSKSRKKVCHNEKQPSEGQGGQGQEASYFKVSGSCSNCMIAGGHLV